MYLLDAELRIDLPRARMVELQPSVRYTMLEYHFSDYNDVVHQGRGPTKAVVQGIATSSEIEALRAATVRNTLYTLVFSANAVGEGERYLQRVFALPVQTEVLGPDVIRYTIEMHALDGYVYDLETGARVS